MKILNSVFVFFLLGMSVYSQPGTHKQLGKAGDWSTAIKAVETNGKIFTIEQSGFLDITDPSSGSIKQIGQADFQNINFMLASENTIYVIDTSGNLYSVNPANAAKKQIGKQGAWLYTKAAALLNGKLYSLEKSGALYATDLTNGNFTQIGNPDFTNIIRLWAANGKLYTHDQSGSLFELNVIDGISKQIGATEGWEDTKTGVVINNMLYTIESSGTLYETDLTTGKWKQIGNADLQNTVFMMGTGALIHTIESSGSLYEIAIQ